MSVVFALLKILLAVVVYVLTMGILKKKFDSNFFLKGFIALFTALSTLFGADTIYVAFTGEKSYLQHIIDEVKGKKAPTIESNVTPKTWNPKIYRGERSYSKNSTYTVKDNYTGLIWQKEDDGKERTWKEAQKYCNELSLSGLKWRLPEQEELYYLGDVTKYNPAVDKAFFNLKSAYYWSNTSYENDSDSAWGVYFDDGRDGWNYKTRTYYVLCVSGQ